MFPYSEDANWNEFVPDPFRKAWATTMVKPKLRNWLFNKSPPTQAELLRLRSNSPIMHLITLVPKDESFFTDASSYHDEHITMVHGQCYFLECGASMGFFFNLQKTDQSAHVLAQYDSVFNDAAIIVRRSVVFSFEGKVFLLELSWLVSGALIIRFIPVVLSTRSVSRSFFFPNDDNKLMWSNPFAQMYTFAFVPKDAQIIETFSQSLSEAFLTSNFCEMGVSSRCYRISQFDTAFQSPCAFCLSRGAPMCSCPTPLRRRNVESLNSTMALLVKSACSASLLWNYYTRNVSIAQKAGSYVFNVKKGCESTKNDSSIIDSGFLNYHCTVTRNWRTHASLQQQMQGISKSSLMPYNVVSFASVLAEERKCAKAALSIWNGSPRDLVETRAAVQFEGLPHPNVQLKVANSKDLRIEPHRMKSVALSCQQEAAQFAVLLSGTKGISPENAKKTSIAMYRCPFCSIEISKKKSNLKRHILNKHKASMQI